MVENNRTKDATLNSLTNQGAFIVFSAIYGDKRKATTKTVQPVIVPILVISAAIRSALSLSV